MKSAIKNSLLVYRKVQGEAGEETVGEFPFTSPYGDSEAQLDPLRKLKPELVGVILGEYGIVAHSAELSEGHPFYRRGLKHVER